MGVLSDQGGGSVTLERLFRLLQDIQAEQREQRTELRDVRSVLLAQVEQGRRLERRLGDVDRRVSELRDDLKLMLKAELMGRLGYLETQIGHRFDELGNRLTELRGRQSFTCA